MPGLMAGSFSIHLGMLREVGGIHFGRSG